MPIKSVEDRRILIRQVCSLNWLKYLFYNILMTKWAVIILVKLATYLCSCSFFPKSTSPLLYDLSSIIIQDEADTKGAGFSINSTLCLSFSVELLVLRYWHNICLRRLFFYKLFLYAWWFIYLDWIDSLMHWFSGIYEFLVSLSSKLQDTNYLFS